MSALAGKCEEIFMLTAAAFYPGKAIMKNTTVKILVYYFFYMRTQITVFLTESSVIYSLKFLIVVFYALVIWSVLGLSPSVSFSAST